MGSTHTIHDTENALDRPNYIPCRQNSHRSLGTDQRWQIAKAANFQDSQSEKGSSRYDLFEEEVYSTKPRWSKLSETDKPPSRPQQRRNWNDFREVLPCRAARNSGKTSGKDAAKMPQSQESECVRCSVSAVGSCDVKARSSRGRV